MANILKSKQAILTLIISIFTLSVLIFYLSGGLNNSKENEDKGEVQDTGYSGSSKSDLEPKLNQNYVPISKKKNPKISGFYNLSKLNLEVPEDVKVYSAGTKGIHLGRGGEHFFDPDSEKGMRIVYMSDLSVLDPESDLVTPDNIYNDYWHVSQYTAETNVFNYDFRTFDLYKSPSGSSPIMVKCSGYGEIQAEIRANCNHIVDNLGVENLEPVESAR
jgi:hypothetical protein